MQARRRHCGEGRDIVDPRRASRTERIGHSHARRRDQHIGDTSQLLLRRKIETMWRLEKRVEELVRYWGVVVQDTLETQSSFIVFGKRGDHDVVLKVIRQPGDEWRSGAVMAAFGAWGMARVYEYIEGALLLE